MKQPGKRDFEAEREAWQAKQSETGIRPRLLLHACCAPCATAVVERLAPVFDLTLCYANPNIQPRAEYDRRLQALFFLGERRGIPVLDAGYDPDVFCRETERLGQSGLAEGGARCERCFRLRLLRTAELAKARGFEVFCTTLTVSPHKNADLVNRAGEEVAAEAGLFFLPADFKKKNGYLRSLELSRQLGLYRQSYCGCRFSFREAGAVPAESGAGKPAGT